MFFYFFIFSIFLFSFLPLCSIFVLILSYFNFFIFQNLILLMMYIKIFINALCSSREGSRSGQVLLRMGHFCR